MPTTTERQRSLGLSSSEGRNDRYKNATNSNTREKSKTIQKFAVKKPAPAPEKFDAQQGNIISGGSDLNIDGANSATVDAPLMDSDDQMWAQKLAGLHEHIRIAPRQHQATQL